MNKSPIFILAITFLAACAAEGAGELIPIGSNSTSLEVTSAEAQGILDVANTATFVELDDDVRLDRRAAQNIVDRRGSGFETLAELDAVPYVGESALQRLLDYAYGLGLVDEGPELVHGIAEGTAEAAGVLRVANTLSFSALDDDVALDRRAAQNIVDGRGTGFESLVALDTVGYVGASAFGKLLSYATDNGFVIDEDAVTFVGARSCGTYYDYFVISDPAPATADGLMTLHFSSTSPYGPHAMRIQVETAPGVFTDLATTTGAISTTQTQTFPVATAELNRAMDAMGWLRFRTYKGTGYSACSALEVVYNCPSCLACPDGEEDLGLGCAPIGADYDFTLNRHATGSCSGPANTLTFPATPVPGSDGTLTFEYAVCDGGSATAYIETSNAGSVDLGTANTSRSCGFTTATFMVPKAYLDFARTESREMVLRYYLRDRCAAGMGCAGLNDPCVRNARLTFGADY